MNELKFNSQICTTIEQSKRLLELGLKHETGDMYYFWKGGDNYHLKVDIDNNPLKYNMDKTYIPAWSLHRLIYMCEVTTLLPVDNSSSAYDHIIDVIERFINEGYFNKEYLKQ